MGNTTYRQPKFLILLAAFYVTVILLTMLVENRVILVGPIHVVTGTLVIPLAYTLSDMITEVYGYKEMRKLIWTSICVLYVVAGLLYLLMRFPSPIETRDVNQAYHVVLQPFTRDVFTYSIAALAGVFLNAYILSKWKIYLRGKSFWLRSLGSSAVGELIFVLLFGFLAFYGVFPLRELVEILTFSYMYKIICNLITVIPSAIIVLLLKRAEGVDTYDRGVKFNPFAF